LLFGVIDLLLTKINWQAYIICHAGVARFLSLHLKMQVFYAIPQLSTFQFVFSTLSSQLLYKFLRDLYETWYKER
jgi:hypothetical protein